MTEIINSILEARYFRDGEKTWEDVCKRVSHYIAESESEEHEFYNLMVDKVFLPNSPCLMNAGTNNPQMSACFVLPIEDSIDSIFDAIKNAAIIHKSGGGTGFNFSHIRPEGSTVKSTDGVASGPVSFMKVFNSATEAIKQGGRRRGANMAILRWNHPDIHKFIHCKEVEGDLSNFNISVMLDDEFMNGYSLDDNKKKIMSEIVEGIHKNGEPGVLFYDAINENNPYGMIEATNPCGEQPLLPYEACNLGSIDISKLVDGVIFNYEKLRKIANTATLFLDRVIDKSKFPLQEVANAVSKTRKIGLGVMGVHDALIKMRIPYDSPDALVFVEHVLEEIQMESNRTSEMIAVEKGAWDDSSKRRNACLTCIAPTGSISLIAECSSGIEPNFSYVYVRKNTVGKEFKIVHPSFMNEINHLNISDYEKNEIINHMFEKGTIQDLDNVPDYVKAIYKTALDISPEDHIAMQAGCQKHVDAAISKTINLREDATLTEIENTICLAWVLRCKGLTIYRNNSRKDVVLELNKKSAENKPLSKRPKELDGTTYCANSGCCKLYITVNRKNKNPYEVLVHTNGTGCSANTEALSRIISIALQNGIPPETISNQFAKVRCISCAKNSKSEGMSCSDIIGKHIVKREGEALKKSEKQINKCPECGAVLEFGEGCNKGVCKNCGWSGCM